MNSSGKKKFKKKKDKKTLKRREKWRRHRREKNERRINLPVPPKPPRGTLTPQSAPRIPDMNFPTLAKITIYKF